MIGSSRGREEIDIELSEILSSVILFGDNIGWVWGCQTNTFRHTHTGVPINKPGQHLPLYKADWQSKWDTGSPAGGGKTYSTHSEGRKGSQWLTFKQQEGQDEEKLLSTINTHKQCDVYGRWLFVVLSSLTQRRFRNILYLQMNSPYKILAVII